MIKDSYGRPVLNLRISVTQRCNLHCPYCHREGQEQDPDQKTVEMTPTEIIKIAKLAISLNISRIKLTGGEPLFRKDILEIVEGIGKLQGLTDLSMTTNGAFLEPVAEDLRTRGLNRVNITLPTLNPDIYSTLMGGNLPDVLRGIEAAVKVELNPVKINMLVLAKINDNEIPEMIQFANRKGALLQLIELEPLNLSDIYYKEYHYSLSQFENEFSKQALNIDVRRDMQNRKIYHLPDGVVEVIHPIENTEFCAHCTRIRLTSDGKLKPCLMLNSNLVDILTPLRNGATEQQLKELFIETCQKRVPFYKASLSQFAPSP